MKLISKDEIIQIVEKTIRSEYGYGGSTGFDDPVLCGDKWIVPVRIWHRRGLFPELHYRKLDQLDLGNCGPFEFSAVTGRALVKPSKNCIFKTEYERLDLIEGRTRVILDNIESARCLGISININYNIHNLLYKMFGRLFIYGFTLDHDIDWIPDGDTQGVEDFAQTLEYLENNALIMCSMNIDGEVTYYPDNILIEMADNSTDIYDLILNVHVALELGEDLNCRFWNWST